MGNGIYRNSELIGTLIVDLNSLPKLLIDGQFIAACNLVSQMGQKLSNLQKGIDNDLKNKDQTIDFLKQRLHDNGIKLEEIPAENLINEEEDGAKHE